MEQRERIRPREPGNPGAPAAGGSGLATRRESARRLLAAGRRAIDRTLSGDSQTFNESVRQDSGQ